MIGFDPVDFPLFPSYSRSIMISREHDALHEKSLPGKCGIVGIWTNTLAAADLARSSLAAIQHRGQESAGLAIFSNGVIDTVTGMGLIPHVITDRHVKTMQAGIAIAHNRYSTTGDSVWANAQPMTMECDGFHLSIAHNGNLINKDVLESEVTTPPPGSSDTSYMVEFLLEKRREHSSWKQTFEEELPKFSGAYSLVMITDDGLFAARDPQEIRPLSLGKLPNGWVIASETVAIDSIGASFVRHVKGGELLSIDEDGVISSSFFGKPASPKRCILENIYFSRPDSFLDGSRVRAGRKLSGTALAGRLKEKDVAPNVIIPVLDSGKPAAEGVAEALNLPIEEAITTSHYVGRTFIMPAAESRIAGVNGKHNIVPDEISGRQVVFVDDSAVRLTTSTKITESLKNAGVTGIDAAFASPPVVEKCDLGVDMKGKHELPASKWEGQPIEKIEKHVADLIGADTVTYLPIKETAQAYGTTPELTCHFCFGGPHPVREQNETFKIRERTIEGKAKLMVLVSGNGSNLQELIHESETGDIDGEIIRVISNKPDAYGVVRAEKHGIPVSVIPSKGRMKGDLRSDFERELFTQIENDQPDLIVLAGWMVILGDEFIQKVAALEIPIINLHPALLTRGNSDTVMTSRGKIPVVRGAHAIPDAYDANLPVSGVTVHQILPGPFDTGPIILTEEVRRQKDDTLDAWERRIHETEYRVLPTAVKRVIHVLKHSIDLCDGRFPW